MHKITRLSIVLLCIITVSLVAKEETQFELLQTHLEFLGYEVKLDEDLVTATHEDNLNFVLREVTGGYLLIAFYTGSDAGHKNRDKWLEVINDLNTEVLATRFYINDEGEMVIEGYYPGAYNKKSFSAFIKAFNSTSDVISKHLKKLLLYIE